MYAGQQNLVQYTQQVNSIFSDKPNRSFHITKLLGGGNEGGVYLAEMKIPEGKYSVALKIQKKMRDDEQNFIDQLILYQNSYENPNNKETYSPSCIIRIHERFNWNKQDVVMMEIGDIDLFAYCKKTKLNLIEKSNICKNIAKSLWTLHSFGYFHRDIKAENFIRVGKEFKLCDFGLIKQMGSRLQTINVGTPMFQAPEQLQKDQNTIENEADNPIYNEKIDIWALGCLLYEILKEEEVFQGATEEEIHNKIRSVEANPNIMKEKIQQLKISSAWQNILIQMFDPNFENRISSKDAYELLNKSNVFQQQVFPTFPQQQPFLKNQQQSQVKQIPQSIPSANPVNFPKNNDQQQIKNLQQRQAYGSIQNTSNHHVAADVLQTERVQPSSQMQQNQQVVTQTNTEQRGAFQSPNEQKSVQPQSHLQQNQQIEPNQDQMQVIVESKNEDSEQNLENKSLIAAQHLKNADESNISANESQQQKIEEEGQQNSAEEENQKIEFLLKTIEEKKDLKEKNPELYKEILELSDKLKQELEGKTNIH